MPHYKNFRAVVYCTAQSMVRISPEGLQRQIDFFQKYVGVDKVYLEPYRDDCLIPREQLHMCKELFRKNGIEVAGGITTTISGQGEADAGRQRLFNTYCFCNERMRNHLKETVEYIASEFDEFIIDDFFFTNCTCDDCRRAKGDRSWEAFRLDLMKEVSENLVIGPARAINPEIRITVKFPNWMESYQEAGYNPGAQKDLFDKIYTGTETRHQRHTDQHLPRYESYSIMRYMENLAPGRNGGGWFDPYQCYPMDCYLEQAYLTVLSRPREVMMFCWGSLYNNKLATPMGLQLARLDKLLSKAGACAGLPCYLPLNAQGEDHVEDYLGMAGIPFEGVPEFPKDAPAVFLTVQALRDEQIVDKLEQYVAAGGKAIVTSGFVKEALGKGLDRMTSIRYRDRTFDATEYMSEPVFGFGNDLSRGGAPVRFPVLEHRNNTTWALAKAFGGDESYGILLRDTYGRGQLLTLAVPDAISDIRKLPQTVLTRIRAELCCGPVYLDAPAQISLFPYDNDAFCIYPYACDGCAAQRIRVRVRGVAEALCPLEAPGREVKPLYVAPNNETVFELMTEPGEFAFYAIRWAENREGTALQADWGSAPHEFAEA